jgi:tetratricopeptide (TPR) repeat protein
VHHAVIMLDESGRAAEHDRREAGLGFGSMDFGDVQGPSGHFLGWTAGKTPRRDPRLAWPLESGVDLVMQLHMLPSGKPEKVRSRVGLFMTDNPPTHQSALVRLSRKDLVIPPGEKSYYLEDRYVLPVDVEAISVYPHAHYLGTLISAYALLPDGSKKWLIRISENWDFAWQDEYRYAEPVFLPRGTELVAQFEFDNSSDNPANPNEPPITVYYGRGSMDEMADVMLQVVSDDVDDLDYLKRHHLEKWLEQETAGLETMLLADPEHAANHHSLAMCYVREGRVSEGISHLEESLRLQPDYAEAHINLGITLNSQRDPVRAIGHFRSALEIRPEYPDAHFNLGVALLMSGDEASARTHLVKAARLRPEMAAAIQSRAERMGLPGLVIDQ